tara:strand:- start:10441 stop:11286 length:846 start_codon:yes stop_codon:yes gene_type:complete
MSDDSVSSANRTWIDRISQAILGEPKDLDQLIELLRDAQQRALLDADALRMIEGVLRVSEVRVEEIMLPRSAIVTIDKDATLEEILPIVIKSAHSRFPVIGESTDEVIGILLAKDLLQYQQESFDKFSIKDIIRPAIFIPESKRLDILLNEFRKNRHHLAIVVDEYGGVNGMVTIEDVLEQIVGDIEDEHDFDKDPFIKKHKQDNYSIKAQTPIEDFNIFFNLEFPDNEFDTIGGLVVKAFGYLPKRGETISIEGIPFSVLRANRRRVQLLKMTYTQPEEV